MKKIAGSIVFLFCLLSIPAIALGWGSATHAYFAKELSGGGIDAQEMYGAMAPDLLNTQFGASYYNYFVDQTHRHFRMITKEAGKRDLNRFAFGFLTHNERWGADFTAHRNGRTTDRGYVITKSESLAPYLKPALEAILEEAEVPWPFIWASQLALSIAHPLIETAIDLLIKRNRDPVIGMELADSARNRSDSVPELLISAYAGGLTRYANVSYEEASSIIRTGEEEFRQMMVRYGEVLAMDESEAVQELAEQGAFLMETYLKSIIGKDVIVPPETLTDMLSLAMRQAEVDYGEEIEATLSYLRKKKSISNDLKRILPPARSFR